MVSGCICCYLLGQLSEMKDILRVIELHYEIVENYEKRINLMRDFIEYNEDVVNNARGMTAKKWMEYIWNQYVVWDDGYYEEEEEFSRDENAYNEIWGD